MIVLTIASTILVSLISLVGVFTLSMKDKLLKKIMIPLVALSAGALMGGAFFHMIPESVAICTDDQLDMVFFNVILGFIIFFVLEKILHWRHCHDKNCKVHTFGYMNLLGDAIHNFIDGLVMGASFSQSLSLGIASTMAISSTRYPKR